jgi:hypothetical protein
VIGSDPMTHQIKPGGQANELTLNAIGFAASGPGVGLYACLSTYYRLAELNTPVSFLSELGEFEVQGQATPPLSDPPLNGCPDDVTIVQPSHPAMSGITAAGLSDWGCSIHEVFNAFPSSYSILATNTTTGLPYILATEEPVAPTPTATPTDTPTETPTAIPCLDNDGDTVCDEDDPDDDNDGCTDEEEGAMGFDPLAWYDFFDVPVPANPDPTSNGSRDRIVNVSDVGAVMFYVPSSPNGVCQEGDRNGMGVDYDCDKDGNGRADGLDYDRSSSPDPSPPWDAGPPDEAVSIADVGAVLAQVPLACGGPP